MIAALHPGGHVLEAAVKLAAARAGLEHNIVFDEHDDDIYVLALLSDALRGLEVALAAA